MSFAASGKGFIPPTEWEEFTYEEKDKPAQYSQEPIYEGSYIDEDDELINLDDNLNHAESVELIEGGFSNPAYQNPPQFPQYQQPPQNPHYLPQPHHHPSSQHEAHNYQPGSGGYGPPTNYIGQNYSTLPCGPSAPQGIRGIGQPPTYPTSIANDPRSAVVTCLPPEAGQTAVVTQLQVFDGQQPVITVQPILEDPPNDYFCFAIFVTFCCCWMFGIRAIRRSRECRRAIAGGDLQLAYEKSFAARNAARISLGFGIVLHVIAGIILLIHFVVLAK